MKSSVVHHEDLGSLYALVNANRHSPNPGNVGHRWGISGNLSIEQAPGGGGLASFGFVLL